MTKGLLLATVSTSVILQATKARRRPPLLVSLFTRAFAFRNPGELLFGASLLYFYRLFERQWGSAKYSSFVAVACGLAYALEAAAGAALALPAAQGPFPLVFANLAANFVLLVPPTHRFTVFGLKMTDKVGCAAATLVARKALTAPPATAGHVAMGIPRCLFAGVCCAASSSNCADIVFAITPGMKPGFMPIRCAWLCVPSSQLPTSCTL